MIKYQPEEFPMDWTDVVWWSEIGLAIGAFVLLGVCSGCSAGGDAPEDAVICDETFSPAPELYDLAKESAYKWQAATGLNVCIRSGGVPVEIVPEAHDDNGDLCGVAHMMWGAKTGAYKGANDIYIAEIALDNAVCKSELHVIMHEMGHVISHRNSYDPPHTAVGLMAYATNTITDIDIPTLEFICFRADCR